MKTPFSLYIVTFVAFLFALAPLALGLSAEEQAKFYLKSGETFKTDTLKISGTTYYILKINNQPAVVLGPDKDGYSAVNDSALLDQVLSQYASTVYAAHDWSKSLSLLNQSNQTIGPVVQDCDVGAATFLKFIPGRLITLGRSTIRLYFLIERSKDNTYKTEYDAIQALNNSFPAFDAAFAAYGLNSVSLKSAVDAKDAAAALKAAGSLRESVDTLKQQYSAVTSAYASMASSKDFSAILKYTYYYQGIPHNCSFNSNVTSSLTSLSTEFGDPALKDPVALKASILSETAARQTTASSQTAIAVRQEKLAKLSTSIQNVTSLYVGAIPSATLALTDLAKKQAQLTSDVNALKSGNSTNAASDFDVVSDKVQSSLKMYASLAPDYKIAAKAVAEADANYTLALRRYGEADSRMDGYKKQLAQIKSDFSANTLSLQGGDFAKVNFANLTSTARDYAYTLGKLQPQESQIDPLIIAAVVVLLLGLGGTVYYFRVMKPKQGLNK